MSDEKTLSEECDKSPFFIGLYVNVVKPSNDAIKAFGNMWDPHLLKSAGSTKTITGRHRVGYHISGSDYIFPISMFEPYPDVRSGKSNANELQKEGAEQIFAGWMFFTKQRALYFYLLNGQKIGYGIQPNEVCDFSKCISFENNGLVVNIHDKRLFAEELYAHNQQGNRFVDFAPVR